MPTKTSPKKYNYSFSSTETANNPRTEFLGVAFKLRKKLKDSPSYIDVLHKTLNFVIVLQSKAEKYGSKL